MKIRNFSHPGLKRLYAEDTPKGVPPDTVSLSVTRNRRLTFRIHTAEREICDLNLEDYH